MTLRFEPALTVGLLLLTLVLGACGGDDGESGSVARSGAAGGTSGASGSSTGGMDQGGATSGGGRAGAGGVAEGGGGSAVQAAGGGGTPSMDSCLRYCDVAQQQACATTTLADCQNYCRLSFGPSCPPSKEALYRCLLANDSVCTDEHACDDEYAAFVALGCLGMGN